MSFLDLLPWRKYKLAELIVVFRGWTDPVTQERFSSDIGYYDDEIRAGRAHPAHPAGLLEMNPRSGERPTPEGSQLSILYLPKQISQSQIIKYCQAIGLDVSPTS